MQSKMEKYLKAFDLITSKVYEGLQNEGTFFTDVVVKDEGFSGIDKRTLFSGLEKRNPVFSEQICKMDFEDNSFVYHGMRNLTPRIVETLFRIFLIRYPADTQIHFVFRNTLKNTMFSEARKTYDFLRYAPQTALDIVYCQAYATVFPSDTNTVGELWDRFCSLISMIEQFNSVVVETGISIQNTGGAIIMDDENKIIHKEIGSFNVDYMGYSYDDGKTYEMIILTRFDGNKETERKTLYVLVSDKDEKENGYFVPSFKNEEQVKQYFQYKNNQRLKMYFDGIDGYWKTEIVKK